MLDYVEIMVRNAPRNRAGDEPTKIDLLDLFGYYITKWPLLVAAALCGAFLSGLFTHFFIPNKYSATSRLYMVSASSNSVVNLADLNLGTTLSNDYVELMKSRPVVEGVIDSLGLDYSYESLLNAVSIDIVPGTRIVKITAVTTSPEDSMDIANQMARISRQKLPAIMNAPTPSIVEEAILPVNRSYPSMSRNMEVGALAVLMAVMGVYTALYMMDDSIRSAEELERTLGIMPLAVIPEGVIEGFASKTERIPARHFLRLGMSRKKRTLDDVIVRPHTAKRPDMIPVLQDEIRAEALSLPGSEPRAYAEPVSQEHVFHKKPEVCQGSVSQQHGQEVYGIHTGSVPQQPGQSVSGTYVHTRSVPEQVPDIYVEAEVASPSRADARLMVQQAYDQIENGKYVHETVKTPGTQSKNRKH